MKARFLPIIPMLGLCKPGLSGRAAFASGLGFILRIPEMPVEAGRFASIDYIQLSKS